MRTGLIRRSGRYSIRRVIPLELREHFKVKREIVRALGTADPHVANELQPIEWVKLSHDFAVARLLVGAKSQSALQANIPTTESAAQRTARADYEQFAQDQSWEDSWKNEEPDPIKQRVAEGIELGLAAAAEERAEARRIARLDNRASVMGMMLPAIVDKWAKEKGPSQKIIETTRKTVQDFYALIGDLPVTAITKQHVITFKDDLVDKQQHPATANGRLSRLRLVMRFAVANAMIPNDPTSGVRIATNRLAKDARTTYDSAALAAVFGSSIYSKGARPKAGAGEAAYWLPLLGLFTGARLNELGQLRPCDVAEETYIGEADVEQTAWVIRFVHDVAAGLRLKTLSSQRRVPIHPELIALGFLRFVTAARANNQARIFPALKPDRHGTITAGWSKWYGRHLRGECNISDKRIVFHSFRHTFKENARYSQLAPDVQNEITGHDTGSVADDYGGMSYPLHPLVEGMNRYRVPRLILPQPYII